MFQNELTGYLKTTSSGFSTQQCTTHEYYIRIDLFKLQYTHMRLIAVLKINQTAECVLSNLQTTRREIKIRPLVE